MITNTYFRIHISLQPEVEDLRYFQLWVLSGPEFKVWNIKGLHHQVAKMQWLEKRICDDCTTPLKGWVGVVKLNLCCICSVWISMFRLPSYCYYDTLSIWKFDKDLFNKIAEFCDNFTISVNLLQKSSWVKNSFGRLTFFNK